MRDPHRRFTLSPKEIALLNPNTRTCPIFRSREEAELTKAIFRRVPVLELGKPKCRPAKSRILWGIRFRQDVSSYMTKRLEPLSNP